MEPPWSRGSRPHTGHSNAAVVEKLLVGAKTVEAHVRSIFTTLGLGRGRAPPRPHRVNYPRSAEPGGRA